MAAELLYKQKTVLSQYVKELTDKDEKARGEVHHITGH
jgi:hypothetical protein